MNKQIEKISSAAKNYAKALDELAQSGAVNYDILDADMRTLYDVLSGSTDLQTVMENPSINIETKFDNDIVIAKKIENDNLRTLFIFPPFFYINLKMIL